MNESIVDLSLGISPQARAVLALLDTTPFNVVDEKEDKIRWNTYAWYNGREKGIAIRMGSLDGGTVLTIVFGESRGSDSTFVDSWESKHSYLLYEPPIWKELPVKAYQSRFATHNPQQAADKVLSKMRAFYKKLKKEAKLKKKGKKAA